MLVNTVGTTGWTTFVNEIQNVELAQRNTHSMYQWISRRWAAKIKKSKEIVHGVQLTDTWRETVERNTNTCKITKLLYGLARTTKAKASLAWAKARTKTKARANTTARKGRKEYTKWKDTTTQDTPNSQDYTERTATRLVHTVGGEGGTLPAPPALTPRAPTVVLVPWHDQHVIQLSGTVANLSSLKSQCCVRQHVFVNFCQ